MFFPPILLPSFFWSQKKKHESKKKRKLFDVNLLSIFEFYLVLKLWKDTIFKTLCFVIMKHFRMLIEKKNTYEISSISFKVVLLTKRGLGDTVLPTQFSLLSFFNRSWRICTTPNTTNFFLIIFKLIQKSNFVILSCLTKKNWNLNLRKIVHFINESCVFQPEIPKNLPFQ